MIRTVITPNTKNILLELPQKYVGKRIEVIAFAMDEPSEKKETRTQTHFASEKVLAKDWLTPQEDKAWKNL